MKDINDIIKRYEVEDIEKWSSIRDEIPILNFKEEWGVKITPPVAGAVARFLIMKDNKQICSIYLDWYDRLGCVGAPYYELYPNEDDDTNRYLLDNVGEMMEDIDRLWSIA